MTKSNVKAIENSIDRLKKILHLNRIKILLILDEKETCACEVITQLKLSNNLVSHHLKVLSDLDILESRKEGLHIKYSIKSKNKKRIEKLLRYLGSW